MRSTPHVSQCRPSAGQPVRCGENQSNQHQRGKESQELARGYVTHGIGSFQGSVVPTSESTPEVISKPTRSASCEVAPFGISAPKGRSYAGSGRRPELAVCRFESRSVPLRLQVQRSSHDTLQTDVDSRQLRMESGTVELNGVTMSGMPSVALAAFAIKRHSEN